jgi:hypothetical protein
MKPNSYIVCHWIVGNLILVNVEVHHEACSFGIARNEVPSYYLSYLAPPLIKMIFEGNIGFIIFSKHSPDKLNLY